MCSFLPPGCEEGYRQGLRFKGQSSCSVVPHTQSSCERTSLSAAQRGVFRHRPPTLGSSSSSSRTQSPFVFAWVFLLLNSWYDLETEKRYLPPSLEGTNLVVYRPTDTRGQLYSQVDRCASFKFPLVHVLFMEGSCVWN